MATLRRASPHRGAPVGSAVQAVRRKPTPSRFFDLAAALANIQMPEDLKPQKPPGRPRARRPTAPAQAGGKWPQGPTRSPSPRATPGKSKGSEWRKRTVSCARAAVKDFRPTSEGDEEDDSESVTPLAEAWLRLSRIGLLELGTRGPKHPTAMPGQLAHKPAVDQSDEEEPPGDQAPENPPGTSVPEADWRSPQVCLGYLLEQSVTWIEPDSDDDLHSPKASLQHPEEDEEQHPAMKAIARQQRAPGLVEGLPKCLSI